MHEAGEVAEIAMLRALASHSNELLVLVRPDGVTEGQLTLGAVPLGYPPEERYANRHVAELVHPDDLPPVLALLEAVRDRPGTETSLQVRARHHDGSWRILDVDVLDRSADPVLGGVVLRVRLAQDPTSETDDAGDTPTGGGHGSPPAAAAGSDDRFRSLAEIVPFGIMSADRRGYVVYANDEAVRILALPPDRLRGDGWEAVIEAQDRTDVAAAAGAVLTHSQRERVTFRANVRGETRWLHAVFVPLGGADARTGWIATLDDVTDRRRAEVRLAHQATHDALTELPNRMLLSDRLAQAVARLEREPEPLSVLFIDLDRFKPVNDRHGHAVGDQVLMEVARRLRSVTRAADTVARVGGDEFVIVCERMAAKEAQRVAERIAALLAEPLLIGGATVAVGASVGVAVTTDAHSDPAALLSQADQAMYRAKQAGGGTVSLAG